MKTCNSNGLGWVLIGLVLVMAPQLAGGDPGPLNTSNRFPLHMMVLMPKPAAVDGPGAQAVQMQVALEYSSVFYDYRNNQWDFLLDMEMTVAALSFVYGLSDAISMAIDLPLVSMGDGFLDGLLENYHDALGVSNYGREDRPADTFAYRVTRDGATVFDGESGRFRLGEMRLSAQWRLPAVQLGQHPLHSAARVTAKLPTGDTHSALGSGHTDFGIYLPAQWRAAPWTIYVMPGYAWINRVQTVAASMATRNIVSLFTGAALQSSDRWRWLGQINMYTSPYESTGLHELDAGAVELTLGLQYRLRRNTILEVAFSEDITRPVPDFNLRVGMTWRWPFKE